MKLVLDIETQNSFKEIGGRANMRLFKISLVGVYWYAEDKYYAFMEDEMDKLADLLKKSELVIGFNLWGFDYPVLENYIKDVNFSSLKTLDILDDVNKYLGYRIKLESLAQGSLGAGKSGTGLDAIEQWRQGKIEELKEYCLKDVEVTKDVYEYGIKNKFIKFRGTWQTYPIPVNWY